MDSRIVLVLAAIGLLVFAVLARRAKMTLDRSPQEVADILIEFVAGERTGHLADDFISIPITDPALDRIREEFDRLADSQTTWEPQAPFPGEGLPQLRRLIEEAEALARRPASDAARVTPND